MCELLGNEPNIEDIPIERSDLFHETQLVFSAFDKLQSVWEGFSGNYLGKDLTLLPTLMDLYNFPDYLKLYAWDVIPYIDSIISDDIAEKIKQRSKSSTSKVKGING